MNGNPTTITTAHRCTPSCLTIRGTHDASCAAAALRTADSATDITAPSAARAATASDANLNSTAAAKAAQAITTTPTPTARAANEAAAGSATNVATTTTRQLATTALPAYSMTVMAPSLARVRHRSPQVLADHTKASVAVSLPAADIAVQLSTIYTRPSLWEAPTTLVPLYEQHDNVKIVKGRGEHRERLPNTYLKKQIIGNSLIMQAYKLRPKRKTMLDRFADAAARAAGRRAR